MVVRHVTKRNELDFFSRGRIWGGMVMAGRRECWRQYPLIFPPYFLIVQHVFDLSYRMKFNARLFHNYIN